MPIPGQTFTQLDPGLGTVTPTVRTPVWAGPSQSGVDYTLKSWARKSDVVAYHGQGPLTEAVCRALDVAGAPQYSMKIAGSVAATAGVVTPTRVGSSTGTITVAGTPLLGFEVQVEIRKSSTGVTVGTGVFRYSLDDGDTFSEDIAIPASMSFAIPNTGLTLTFVVGAGPTAFELGDLHEFDCTEPYFGTADLASAVTALRAAPTATWVYLVLTGRPATAAAGATLFGALATHMASFVTDFRFTRCLTDFGDDTVSNVQTQLAGVSDRRVSVSYGTVKVPSAKPFAGWGFVRVPASVAIGAHGAALPLSTDLGRVASGPLVGARVISHDEFQLQTLNDHRIMTLRTFRNKSGVYVTNGWLKSPVGSDYQFWQYGAVMDEACRIVHELQTELIGEDFRTIPIPAEEGGGGKIDPREAEHHEDVINNALRDLLLVPKRANGKPGHVSAVRYQIDRTNNILGTGQLLSELAVRPLAYAKTITTSFGFAVEV